MAFISNGTTVASGGTVQGSASNLTGIPAPSNSAILTGVASVSAGAVGSYGMMKHQRSASGSYFNPSFGDTMDGSRLQPVNVNNETVGSYQSGSWRCMGEGLNGTGDAQQSRISVWLRIS